MGAAGRGGSNSNSAQAVSGAANALGSSAAASGGTGGRDGGEAHRSGASWHTPVALCAAFALVGLLALRSRPGKRLIAKLLPQDSDFKVRYDNVSTELTTRDLYSVDDSRGTFRRRGKRQSGTAGLMGVAVAEDHSQIGSLEDVSLEDIDSSQHNPLHGQASAEVQSLQPQRATGANRLLMGWRSDSSKKIDVHGVEHASADLNNTINAAIDHLEAGRHGTY